MWLRWWNLCHHHEPPPPSSPPSCRHPRASPLACVAAWTVTMELFFRVAPPLLGGGDGRSGWPSVCFPIPMARSGGGFDRSVPHWCLPCWIPLLSKVCAMGRRPKFSSTNARLLAVGEPSHVAPNSTSVATSPRNRLLGYHVPRRPEICTVKFVLGKNCFWLWL